jgi:hypothetical protein
MQIMRNINVGLAAAAIGFVVGLARPASSTIYTMEESACAHYGDTWFDMWCAPTGGTGLTAGPSKAYFDIQVNAGTISSIRFSIIKKTYTGTYSEDDASATNVTTGWHEYSVTAANAKATNSVWDYYVMRASQLHVGDELVGMTMVTN